MATNHWSRCGWRDWRHSRSCTAYAGLCPWYSLPKWWLATRWSSGTCSSPSTSKIFLASQSLARPLLVLVSILFFFFLPFRVWISHKIVRNYAFPTSQWYNNTFALRHRMLNFLQNLLYYITVEVLEPSWQTFVEKIRKVDNVDQVPRKKAKIGKNNGISLSYMFEDCLHWVYLLIVGHIDAHGVVEYLHEGIDADKSRDVADGNKAHQIMWNVCKFHTRKIYLQVWTISVFTN